MPLLVSALVVLLLPALCHAETVNAWRTLLAAVNLSPEMGAPVILPEEAQSIDPAELEKRIQAGSFAILEGPSLAAERLGFVATKNEFDVRSIVDALDPQLTLIWEQPLRLPVYRTHPDARVFVKERWQGAALVAGYRKGNGAVLWAAADPGPTGHERFPYIVQALQALGLQPQITSRRLWVFLDTSYRMRADVEYLARLWRKNGVAAVHIAAWHYFEPDEQRDEYLRRLVGAAHRNSIHTYAWLELPHVSEKFWLDHPEWREKTATGADAQLDWRKLMNLRNRECAQAVKNGVRELLRRFDWDGVNLAELYFESLEGHENPSRFTPMNEDVRREFQGLSAIDPWELFHGTEDKHWTKNVAGLTHFLEYRAELARAIQQEWIGEMETLRKDLPNLDLVLTHVDNLLQPDTKDRIGADARKVLPLMQEHDFTFLVEDPATAWDLGPNRYPKIAALYAPHLKRAGRLAVDINVVERYQDVYPTKQQVGTELFREVHLASLAFDRVTLYFENSIRKVDWPWIGAAGAAVQSIRREADSVTIDTRQAIGIRWTGDVKVNGNLWPVTSDGFVWLPAGVHALEHSNEPPRLRIIELNAELRSASISGDQLDFAYSSTARAFVTLSKTPKKVSIDGVETNPKIWVFDDTWILVLPRGQHLVTILS